MAKYTKLYNPTATPQSEPIPGREADMAANNAGGYSFTLDDWGRLERFLILGSDAPTYYQSAQKLTAENAKIVTACWSSDPKRTAQIIGDISAAGRAPRNSPAIFALALGVVHLYDDVRQCAYAAMPRVCRTASHLFEWIATARALGKGWGRGMKRAVAKWMEDRSTDDLAYQMVKYRNRNGYTHKRVIELVHRGSGTDLSRGALLKWARGKDLGEAAEQLPAQVKGHLYAMAADTREELIHAVTQHRLPWEAIPTEALNDPGVWNAMVPTMGMTALIRNLGNMTGCGAIAKQDWKHVADRLTNEEVIRKSRVHPFTILQALAVYKNGQGIKGSKTWDPVRQIVDALDEAFYAAFANVEPTGKNILIGLDVSGSMGSSMMGSSLTVREAATALALVTMATEENTLVVGFTAGSGGGRYGRGTGITELTQLTPKMRLDAAVRSISGLPFGATDCALPILYAQKQGLKIDAYITITDNETWHGDIHPTQALRQYRTSTGIPARNIVIGMTSQGFTIADPSDPFSLDVVGFDSNVPALIADFIGRKS